MLLNADGVASLLETNDKGAKAQVGYDLTLKSINKVNGGMVMKDKTTVFDYDEVSPFINDDGKFSIN